MLPEEQATLPQQPLQALLLQRERDTLSREGDTAGAEEPLDQPLSSLHLQVDRALRQDQHLQVSRAGAALRTSALGVALGQGVSRWCGSRKGGPPCLTQDTHTGVHAQGCLLGHTWEWWNSRGLVSQHLNQKGRCGGSIAPLHVLGGRGISLSTTGQTLHPRQGIYKQVGGSKIQPMMPAGPPVLPSRNQDAIKADVRYTLRACGPDSSSDEAQICLPILNWGSPPSRGRWVTEDWTKE